MYDYGSPEKNKQHYGNVSVMVTLFLAPVLMALILLFYQAGSVTVNIGQILVIVAFLRTPSGL